MSNTTSTMAARETHKALPASARPNPLTEAGMPLAGARALAERFIAPPAPVAQGTSAVDAYAHLVAVEAWLNDHVHGDETVNSAVSLHYRPAEQAMLAARVNDAADALAKVKALAFLSKRNGEDLQGFAAPMLEQIMPALERALDRRPTPAWDEARNAYLAAKSNAEELSRRSDALWEACNAAVPKPGTIVDKTGTNTLMEGEINALPVSAALKAQLKEMLQQHRAERQAWLDAHGYDEVGLQLEAAEEAEGEAYARIMEMPAPDVAALAFKMSVVFDGVDDPEQVAEVLTRKHDYPLLRHVLVYRDAVRLAGIQDEAASVEAWDVEVFGQQFLAVASGDWSNNGSPSFVGERPDQDPSHALWQTLPEWKKAAMRDWLKTQPRPELAKRLEEIVREEAAEWLDPSISINDGCRRLHCGAGEAKAVTERVADLYATHAAYMERVGGWIDCYLAAGGNFMLDGDTPGAWLHGVVFIGRSPENDEAAKLDQELTGALRPKVIDEVRRRMGRAKATYLSGAAR
jgi:hypothetical protein